MLDGYELVVSCDGGAPADAVVAALGAEFTVTRQPSRRVRRTWLDSFDWRLFRAGLALEHRVEAGRGELRLATLAGAPVASAPVGELSWPGRVDSARLGTLGARLAAVLAERALLPVARLAGTERPLRLLDGEQKTVVRLTVEQAAAAARVSIGEVRGYRREAQRAYRLLAAAQDIRAGDTTLYAEVLRHAGRTPGDYPGKSVIALAASMPAGHAMALLLLQQLDVIEANLDGTVGDLDSEFLHDLRIAVRRTRSGLKLAGDALPPGLADAFVDEFRWLGTLTSPVRDLDAFLAWLDGTAADLQASCPQALQPLHDHLDRQRRAERERLLAGLRSRRFRALSTNWRKALVAVPDRDPGGTADTVAELAADRIARAYRRIRKHSKTITESSPPDDVHELRKRGKQMRYLLEYFTSLYPPAAHRSVVKELKLLQDCLGVVQDGQFQIAVLAAVTTQTAAGWPAPEATLRAVAELSTRLDTQQRAARLEFADRLGRFTSRGTAQLVGTLTGQEP